MEVNHYLLFSFPGTSWFLEPVLVPLPHPDRNEMQLELLLQEELGEYTGKGIGFPPQKLMFLIYISEKGSLLFQAALKSWKPSFTDMKNTVTVLRM